jgi:uncharacterized protein (TIGR02145 family)
VPALTISSSTTNNPNRPGIRFSNNTSQFISGDDLSDELFGFYSVWANKRTYDAKLRVYGKAVNSWGKYIEITHDGNNAHITTDAGDIEIAPAGETKIKSLVTPVDAKDAVNKAYVDELKAQIEVLKFLAGISTVTDIDGNVYKIIKIGNQVWMSENLKVIHYPNGDPIPLITSSVMWQNLPDDNMSDAYCWYDDDIKNKDIYGALYTYAAAIGDNWERDNSKLNKQGICPDGWHLPSDEEWTELIGYLGGEGIAGGRMKDMSTTYWNSPNTGADNSSGFTALPGGYRHGNDGTFNYVGLDGLWWSSTEHSSSNAYCRHLDYGNAHVDRYDPSKSFGLSVRCIRD